MKRADESYSLGGRCWSRIRCNQPGGWYSGSVVTPNGQVDVYSESSERLKVTFLTMAFGGRVFRRRIDRSFTARGLAVVAGKFSRDLLGDWRK